MHAKWDSYIKQTLKRPGLFTTQYVTVQLKKIQWPPTKKVFRLCFPQALKIIIFLVRNEKVAYILT